MEEQILDLSNTLNEEKSKNTLLSKDYNDCKLELSELNKLYEENDTILKDYKMKLEVQVKSYKELEKKLENEKQILNTKIEEKISSEKDFK